MIVLIYRARDDGVFILCRMRGIVYPLKRFWSGRGLKPNAPFSKRVSEKYYTGVSRSA
jgi:hypothetical protein